jgi:hypothetical protein
MAYGYCPNCRCGVRYRVSPQHRAPWLAELAAEVGRGEAAALLCYGCWKPLEIGDGVEVLDPPFWRPEIGGRAKGTVTGISRDDGHAVYLVEGQAACSPWNCRFYRTQIKALEAAAAGTVRLILRAD